MLVSMHIQMKAHPESRRQAEEQIELSPPQAFPQPFPWQFPHPAPVGEHKNLPHICIFVWQRSKDFYQKSFIWPSQNLPEVSRLGTLILLVLPAVKSSHLEVKWFTRVSHSQQVTATGTRITIFRFMLRCVLHCIRLFPKQPGDDLPPSVCLTGGG